MGHILIEACSFLGGVINWRNHAFVVDCWGHVPRARGA